MIAWTGSGHDAIHAGPCVEDEVGGDGDRLEAAGRVTLRDEVIDMARRDRQAEGLADDDPNWRTKRLLLAKYDELAEHARTGTTYVSPDPPPPLPERLQAPSGTMR